MIIDEKWFKEESAISPFYWDILFNLNRDEQGAVSMCRLLVIFGDLLLPQLFDENTIKHLVETLEKQKSEASE